MNSNIVEGKWKEIAGKAKAKWSKLTDDDVGYASGRLDQLKGALQKKYGYEKDKADKEVDTFMDTFS